ncbi:MAG: DUF3592 domain-containing protein [Candidatus Korobacteraceae bacterium]
MHRKEIAEALLFFLGFYLLSRLTQSWSGIRRKLRYRGSRDWPLAEAVVQAHRLENHGSRTRSSYQIIVEYSYSFSGQRYSGSFKSDEMYFESDAARFRQRYPMGMSMMARVNPVRPEDSVLELPE